MRISLAALATTLFLTSCATPVYLSPINVRGARFTATEPPAPGLARVYIFRPEVGETGALATPMVFVDGKPTFVLDLLSYRDLELPPGEHIVKVQPNLMESSKWGGEMRIDMQAGATYYVAIWGDPKYIQAPTTMMFSTPAGLLSLPIGPTRTHVVANGVRFELFEEWKALNHLKRKRVGRLEDGL